MDRLKFVNRNGQQLSGVLHKPESGSTRAYALFAHCFTCTKNIKAAVNIADALADEGVAVLRFDFTGLGQSEGDFADTHFSSNVEDLVDAARFLGSQYEPPKILVGHSLGGTAMMAAAHEIPSATAVATLGSPSDAEHVLQLIKEDIDQIEAQGEATVQLAGRPFRIKKSFIDDTREQNVRAGLGNLRKALLVMHSPVDDTVSIEQASQIFLAARHPKSFVTLDDADHLLSRETDSRYAARVLSAWVSRYLGDSAPTMQYPPHSPECVVTRNDFDNRFLCTINAGGHLLLADEPATYGGTNQGTTPYGLLTAALGACTAMTLNLYARKKKLPVTRITVSAKHDKIHALDCEQCETRDGKVDQFDHTIAIEGDLSDDQRQRMLEIANMCPVHRTLHAEVSVISRLVD